MSLLPVCAIAVAVSLGIVAAMRLARRGSLWLRSRHRDFAEQDLADLFIFIPPRRLSLTLAALGGLVFCALAISGAPWLLGLSLALAVVTGPRWMLGWLRRRRQLRLMKQLPDAIALLAGLLRAGHGLTQGLSLLTQRQAAPLGQELLLLVRKHRLGVPLDTALQELARRVPEPDVALFVLAVRVSREVGGNLAESLLRLGEGVRSRLILRERIDALTAQGKLQGLIIGLLPLILMFVLSWVDPEPMRMLTRTSAGWATLLVIAVLELCGFLLIRRIVRIDL